MYEEQIPLYAENFYDWSEQGHGMAEYATWLALTEAGLGAQMPFGSIEAAASEKDMMSDAERFKFFN